jgi:hypothetical protein
LSPLTKTFVVLLVILSLLLAAGTVTFVNTIGDQRAAAQTALQKAQAEGAAANRARAAAESERAAAETARTAAVQQIETLSQQMNQFRQVINKSEVENADLKNRMAIQMGDVTRLTDAVKALQDANSKQSDQIAALRQQSDQAVTQAAQASATISELTNKLEVTERDRKFAMEQLEQARQDVGKLRGAVGDLGGNVDAVLAGAGPTNRGAPRINGVVRDVRQIAGVNYATISVGSADGVTKGMEFKIVDRNTGNFLGIMTIDTAEPNESVGRITGGPRVAEVHPGVEVRTQL